MKRIKATYLDTTYIPTIKEVNDWLAIEVVGLHHDGRNNFTIRLLTDYANNRWYETENIDLTRRCYHKTLKDYLF